MQRTYDFFETRHDASTGEVGGIVISTDEKKHMSAFMVTGTLQEFNFLKLDSEILELKLQHPSTFDPHHNYRYSIQDTSFEATIHDVIPSRGNADEYKHFKNGKIKMGNSLLVLTYPNPNLHNGVITNIFNAKHYSIDSQPFKQNNLQNMDVTIPSLIKACDIYLAKLSAQLPNDLLAKSKHAVIINAKAILELPGDDATKLLAFRDKLNDEANKALLATRRDSNIVTILKIVAVGCATILGVGVGGYFAYQSFFGSKATNGLKLVGTTEEAATKLGYKV